MSSMNNEMHRYTYEEIHAMSAHELRDLMNSYKGSLLKNRQLPSHVRDYLEVEYCYLQRELQERERWNPSPANRERTFKGNNHSDSKR